MEHIDVVFSGDRLRAIGTMLDRPRILVTFDHREKNKTGFSEYRRITRAINLDFGHLAISTAANDWYLNEDTGSLAAALETFCVDKETLSVGFSMGGYGSILFARALRLRRMLLIAPQYSIFPQHAPGDPRYASYAECLDPCLDVIPKVLDASPSGLVLYDPRLQPFDRKHAMSVCHHFPNIRPVALSFGGHPPMHNFEKGVEFTRMLMALLKDQLTPRVVRNLHRAARGKSERYNRHLAKYLKNRALRSLL